MADERPVHTVPRDGKWANVRGGSPRASKTFDRKSDAQAAGRSTAKRSGAEHVIHNRDEKIAEKNSYGNDPHPPKG